MGDYEQSDEVTRIGSVVQDGVFFDMGTLPGGTTASFNGGKTAVHEIGHW
jgi:hypothetical protein